MRTDDGEGRSGEGLTELLEAMAPTAVFARDRYLTVVAANERARAMSTALRPGSNLLQWLFLSDDQPDCVMAPNLPGAATALLRDSLEQHDHDDRFRSLIGELASRGGAFSRMWADASRAPAHTGIVAHSRTGGTIRFQELRIVDEHELVVVVLYEAA